MMFEFAVSENSVIRGFGAGSGKSMSEHGSRSSNDLGSTSRILLSPFVDPYEYFFDGRIATKEFNLRSLYMATKAKLDHFKNLGYLPPPELKVPYVVREKNSEGKEEAKMRYCVWQHVNTRTDPSVRFYHAEVENDIWTKLGNGKEVENGIKNHDELYERLRMEAKIWNPLAGTGDDSDIFSAAGVFSDGFSGVFSDEDTGVETYTPNHHYPHYPDSPRSWSESEC